MSWKFLHLVGPGICDADDNIIASLAKTPTTQLHHILSFYVFDCNYCVSVYKYCGLLDFGLGFSDETSNSDDIIPHAHIFPRYTCIRIYIFSKIPWHLNIMIAYLISHRLMYGFGHNFSSNNNVTRNDTDNDNDNNNDDDQHSGNKSNCWIVFYVNNGHDFPWNENRTEILFASESLHLLPSQFRRNGNVNFRRTESNKTRHMKCSNFVLV